MSATITHLGIAPKREAVISTLRTGSDLDMLLTRAVQAHIVAYGAGPTAALLKREIIKLERIAGVAERWTRLT